MARIYKFPPRGQFDEDWLLFGDVDPGVVWWEDADGTRHPPGSEYAVNDESAPKGAPDTVSLTATLTRGGDPHG